MVMSTVSSPIGRILLPALTAAGVLGVFLGASPSWGQAQPASQLRAKPRVDTAIRPFHISVPEDALVDLRQRLAATRWPDRETVTDQSQGVPLATMQKLVRYWRTSYDWRKAEAR